MQDFILHLIEQLKYLGIFIAAFIEGPLAALAAGFLVKSGLLHFWLTCLAHGLGDLSADMFYFFVGRSGSKTLMSWVQWIFRFNDEEVLRLKGVFTKHPLKIIFLGKLTHFLGLPAIIGIGLSDYSWKKFLGFNLLATIIKSTLLVWAGCSLGSLWQAQANLFSRLSTLGVTLFILILVYFVIQRNYGKKA